VTPAFSLTHVQSAAQAAPGTRRDRRARTDAVASRLRDAEHQSSNARDLLIHELIENNLDVATSIASRYRNRGIDVDDLQQVALLGLTKAAKRFDPDAGHDFLSFAVPTIRGEVRRHFRDAGWAVRPPRSIQELQARITRAQDELEQHLGRSPRPSEVAGHLGVALDDVVEALSLDGCFTPTSLDSPLDSAATTLGDLLRRDDEDSEAVEAKVMLQPLISALPERERRIVLMRFYDERTQREIAEAVGLTQAHVSRILSKVLAELRAGLGDAEPAA
jgi:RNA polymerase sigma-B factor